MENQAALLPPSRGVLSRLTDLFPSSANAQGDDGGDEITAVGGDNGAEETNNLKDPVSEDCYTQPARETTSAAPAMSACQKKNKMRKVRKKKRAADARVSLEMGHMTASNEVSSRLYAVTGTNTRLKDHMPASGVPKDRSILRPYIEALMEDPTVEEVYYRTAQGILSTDSERAKLRNKMETEFGEVAANRWERDIREALAEIEGDLNSSPLTDLPDQNSPGYAEAEVNALPAPYNWLLDTSINSASVRMLREFYYYKLTNHETRNELESELGEDVADAIREDLAGILAAAQEADLAAKSDTRALNQEPEDYGEAVTSASLTWRPNVELFSDIDSFVGISDAPLSRFHYVREDGKWEWRLPGHPSEQRNGASEVQQQIDLPATVDCTFTFSEGVQLAQSSGSTLQHRQCHASDSSDLEEHRARGGGFSKQQVVQDTIVTKQTPSRIPVAELRLPSTKPGQARQHCVRKVKGMVFPRAASMSEDRESESSLSPALSNFDHGSQPPDGPETPRERPIAVKAELEAELDALIEDWRPLQEENEAPKPGTAEMAELTKEIFEPATTFATQLERHREWLDDFRREREADELRTKLIPRAKLDMLEAEGTMFKVDSLPVLKPRKKAAAAKLTSDKMASLMALHDGIQKKRESLHVTQERDVPSKPVYEHPMDKATTHHEREVPEVKESTPSQAELAIIEADVATAIAEMKFKIEKLPLFKPRKKVAVSKSTNGIVEPSTASYKETEEQHKFPKASSEPQVPTYPISHQLHNRATTNTEREAVQIAAAQRDERRFKQRRDDPEYVHPLVDRTRRLVRPDRERRFMSMEKKAAESLTDRLCWMRRLQSSVGGQNISDGVLPLAQSAAIKWQKAIEEGETQTAVQADEEDQDK